MKNNDTTKCDKAEKKAKKQFGGNIGFIIDSRPKGEDRVVLTVEQPQGSGNYREIIVKA